MPAALPSSQVHRPDAPRAGAALAASPQAALREIERRLAHAMSLAQLVDWEYDVASGRFTFSDRYFALHGTTPELEGGNVMSAEAFVREFMHPDDAHLVADEVAKTVATTDPNYLAQVEARIFRRDGELRHVLVHIAIAKDAAGRTILLRGANQDITERKRSEQELRNLWRAVEQTPATVMITNLSGTIEYVNPKFVEITGYSVAEALGQNPRLLKSGKHPASFYEAMWQVLLHGSVWQGELRNKKKSGELYWESARIAPVRDEKGTITHLVAIKEDITERKRVEEDLVVAKEAADAANRAKSEFLAMMSHEIRTPMNGLIGFTNLLLETPLSEEQRQFAQTIRLSGQTLLNLINDILDFSKIEAGKLTMEAIRFDLSQVVQEVAGLLSVQAQQKRLTLQVQCEPALPRQLFGDPGRVRQVLLNLAGNAIKFTRRGGVTIHVQVDAAHSGWVHCEIVDTGIGIPADQQGKLFQLFSQADASTTRRYGGTGLGLAISKRLVELMGGQIGLTSEPNKGSTFWFTLPVGEVSPGEAPATALAALATAGPAGAPGADAPPPARFRVLLAEDDATNRKLVTHLLKRLSCHIDVAANGREAVALAARHAHDLILMDCLMPEMGGLEATREIRRAENGTGRVPIIAITASVSEDQREKCLAAGMDDFVEKPIQGRELERALRKWVAGPESRQPHHPPCSACESSPVRRR